MTKQSYGKKQVRIARLGKALGNPARIAILEFLSHQEICFFGQIHEILPIAKATASQHLKELKEAGLIQGEIMGPKVRYCINRETWNEARVLFSFFFGEIFNNKNNCCKNE